MIGKTTGRCLRMGVIVMLLCGLNSSVEAAGRWTVSFEVGGKRFEGMPIIWTDREIRLLARDGQMHQFTASQATNVRKISNDFRGYSSREMQRRLRKEFGRAFEVTGTGHFLVVHPKGQGKRWSSQFEQLYRTSRVYFSSRGIHLKRPPFVMVAVVFPTEQQFRQYARKTGNNIPTSYLGYYDLMTNRILMFDFQRHQKKEVNESINNSLIIHEATHQTAFNVGVHSRYAVPSRWICEGIGTLFEAPGIHNANANRELADRVNADMLYTFRQLYPDGVTQGDLTSLIASDNSFRRNIDKAYALSWALTFMLAEQRPRSLAKYLKKSSSHQLYSEYASHERIRDFTSMFGRDLRLLAFRLNQFTESLP